MAAVENERTNLMEENFGAKKKRLSLERERAKRREEKRVYIVF